MERWKPEYGEKYWFVDTNCGYDRDTWFNDTIDNKTFEAGNCFRTKSEAKSAAEKVKELLLHLQPICNKLATNLQDKPLPKLTAEVFNRPDCPEWAKYAVVNMHGTGFFYENEPSYGTENYKGLWYVDTGRSRVMQDIIFDFTDWQNSLVERSAKLPKWCKVGEWVYVPETNAYHKITFVDESQVNTISYDTDCCSRWTHQVVIEETMQARLRPYNAEEMKALVGKVIERHNSAYLIIAYAHDELATTVLIEGKYLDANDLMRVFTIDNKPAGVLEHLEGDEWVE